MQITNLSELIELLKRDKNYIQQQIDLIQENVLRID